MVAGLHFTVCFFLIRPRSLIVNKEWRGLARAWCEWDRGRVSAGWEVFPVGGGGGDGRSGKENVVPGDWRMPRRPLLRRRPRDLVKVQPPNFWEVPLRWRKNIEVGLIMHAKVNLKDHFFYQYQIYWPGMLTHTWNLKPLLSTYCK